MDRLDVKTDGKFGTANPQASHWIFLRGLARESGHWYDFPGQFHDFFMKLGISPEFELLDLPGAGTRNHEPVPDKVSDWIVDLRKNSKFISEGKRPYLLSVSLGGMVALEWAKQFPEDFRGLVLINTSTSNSRSFRRLRPFSWKFIIKALMEPARIRRETIILDLTVNSPNIDKNLFAKKAQALAQKHPLPHSSFYRQLQAAKHLGKWKSPPPVPALLLASRKDRLCHYTCSVDLARIFQCTLRIHETAGHDLPLDDANWIFLQIKEWLYS